VFEPNTKLYEMYEAKITDSHLQHYIMFTCFTALRVATKAACTGVKRKCNEANQSFTAQYVNADHARMIDG